MTLLRNYKNAVSKKNITNVIYLVNVKFNIQSLEKYTNNSEYSFLSDLLKTSDIKKEILNLDDGISIKPTSGKTETAGSDLTIFQQIFLNLRSGRFASAD